MNKLQTTFSWPEKEQLRQGSLLSFPPGLDLIWLTYKATLNLFLSVTDTSAPLLLPTNLARPIHSSFSLISVSLKYQLLVLPSHLQSQQKR